MSVQASILRAVADSDPDAGLSLPGWVYHDPEFFEAEKARVLRQAWQVVCHTTDVAAAGDWHTLEYLGESIIVVRGDDVAGACLRQCLPASRFAAGRWQQRLCQKSWSAPIMPGPMGWTAR